MNEFDEYINETEPGRKEKARAWQTAIGLQDVDGLKVSSYLIENARKHIEGEISIDDVRRDLKEYYETKTAHDGQSDEQEVTDRIASNIVKLLGKQNELHNRDMHIFKVSLQNIIETNHDILNCILTEMAVINALKQKPKATQTGNATLIGKSAFTVMLLTSSLVDKGILTRVNGYCHRNGWWQINK